MAFFTKASFWMAFLKHAYLLGVEPFNLQDEFIVAHFKIEVFIIAFFTKAFF